ncbi:MAG: hypothetical protein FWH41_06160 [Treponema sp.]|nr:hypothetical protein [Treponema sp.]
MKYESDILETIHENAIIDFQLGLISEAEMREYDELCLSSETIHDDLEQEEVNIKHSGLVTA